MRVTGSFSGWVLGVIALVVTSVNAAPRPSIEDFAAEPGLASPALSPDGNRLVYLTTVDDKRVVAVLDLTTKQTRAVLAAEADSFVASWCRFKNDERVICSFRSTQFDVGRPFWITRLVAFNSDGSNQKVLVQNGKAGASQFQDRILHWLPDERDSVLIELDADGSVFPEAYRLNVYSGRLTRVQGDRAPVVSWYADRSGAVRFGFGFREERGQYITRADERSPWQTLLKFNTFDNDEFEVLGFGPLGRSLLIAANHNGRDAIFEMDLDDQSDRQLLFSRPDVDVGSPVRWPTDGRVVGFSFEDDRAHVHYIDGDVAQIQSSIDAVLTATQNSIVGASRNSRRILVAAWSDVKPTEYHLLDLDQKSLAWLGSSNPSLAGLSPMRAVTIVTPDKVKLPGYVSLPVGSSGKNLPTIIYPHGGPHARDSWGFDEVVQFLTSRGYAVVQVNFRGSTGYGYEWYEAGLRNWGTVMVDDIAAAAQWAVGEGFADPRRTCIVGWSYGGYAALMGAVRQPELYRCAASIAGVTDLRGLQRQERRFYGGRASTRHFLGTDAEELKAGSPLKNAERITVPVLFVHGDADTNVVIDHSRNMARALDKANKPNKLVVIKDGDHSLSRAAWRTTLFTELEQFLAANLGAQTPASPQVSATQ